MFRSLVQLICFLAATSVLSIPVFGWDDTGHKISGYIAWQRMTPEVRERVVKILLAAPEDSQVATFYMPFGSRTLDTRKREYFMLMTTWADIIRDRTFDTRYKKYHKGNWHYSDTFWQWKDGKAVLIDHTEKGGLALAKLTEFDKLIRSTASDADKAIAIVWIEHLIGDLHQPLHTSAKVTDGFPKGDQGGNLFFLTPKGTPRDKQENLHWFWDSIVVRYSPNSKDRCEADYVDPLAQEMMRLHPYDKLKDQLKPVAFEAWVKESFEIATSDVYKDLKWGEMPTETYKKKAYEIAQRRLTLAGYRMGDLFNEVFSASATPAVAPPK